MRTTGVSKTEEALFVEFRSTGEPRHLAELYDRVAPELFQVARHLRSGPGEAEDLLQATFLAAIEGADAFDAERRVLPWLLGILANRARAARARERREPASLEPAQAPADADADPARTVERAELREALEACLARVPAAFHEALALRLREGLTAREIGERLGRPYGTVRSQLQRGLAFLRRALPVGLGGGLAGGTAGAQGPAAALATVRRRILERAAHGAQPLAPGLALAKPALGAAALLGTLAIGAVLLGRDGPSELVARSLSGAAAEVRGEVEAPPPAPSPPLDATGSRRALAAERGEPGGDAGPPSPAPATGHLEVWIRSADGLPVADEIVVVRAPADEVPPAVERTVATRGDGRAFLEDLPAGEVDVRVLRGTRQRVEVRAGETARLHCGLRRGLHVRGRVVDAEGRAVPGAGIWLSERWSRIRGHVVARADAAGAFELRAVDPDQVLAARAPGHGPSGVRRIVGRDGGSVEVVLELAPGGARLAGRVVDAGETPVGGARVLVGDASLLEGEPGSGAAPPSPPERTRSAADGTFLLDDLSAGPAVCVVRAVGRAPLVAHLVLAPGRTERLELVLPVQGRVVGTVLDGDGRPVGGARVATDAGIDEELLVSETRTDEQGRFELTGLAAGPADLVAEHEERGRARATLALVAGGESLWNPVLAPEPRLFGKVLERDGRPAEGWIVSALSHVPPRLRLASEPTDASGSFSILAEGSRRFDLAVHRPGGWRDFPSAERGNVRADGEPLVLRLDRDAATTGVLEGRVEGADGRRPRGVRLGLWHVEERRWSAAAVDEADGSFRVEGIPPGTLEVSVESDTHPARELPTFRIDAGRTTDAGTVRLAAGARVTARVRGGAGLPAGSVRVRAVGLDEALAFEPAGEGTFRSEPLAAGRHVVLASAEGFWAPPVELSLAAGEEATVDLDLEPARPARVECVLEAGGRAPRSFSLRVEEPGGRLVDATGELETDGVALAHDLWLPPGTYRVEARTNNGLRGSARLVVGREDDAPRVELRLARP